MDLKNRKQQQKEEEHIDDSMVEDMLQKAVQEVHRRILVNRESEWLMEKMDIVKSLTEAQNEIKSLKSKMEKEREIPKTK